MGAVLPVPLRWLLNNLHDIAGLRFDDNALLADDDIAVMRIFRVRRDDNICR